MLETGLCLLRIHFPNFSFNIWFSQRATTTGNFDFGLGGLKVIQSFAYWADPQGLGQSVNAFNLLADDNAAFSSPTLLGSFSANDGPGGGPAGEATNFGQVFAFAPTEASFVRMEILSNHGSTVTSGISEAAFELGRLATPPVSGVPEPTTLALLGVAIAAFGLSRRRKKA